MAGAMVEPAVEPGRVAAFGNSDACKKTVRCDMGARLGIEAVHAASALNEIENGLRRMSIEPKLRLQHAQP